MGLHIIIVGAGRVGRSLALQLRKENHDITLVDRNATVLSEMENLSDILCVNGNGASYNTLSEANLEKADLLIAVTGSDELNLLCCTMAKRSANCAAIARVRDPDYSVEAEYIREQLGLAMIVNPEQETAQEIATILTLPAAQDVNPFAHGMAEIVRLKIEAGNALVGKKLQDLKKRFSGEVLICGVERNGNVTIPSGDFVVEIGDIVAFVGTRRNISRFFRSIGIPTGQVRTALIIGADRGGYYLAKQLMEQGVEVKLVERSRERCEELAGLLHDAIIINGNGLSTDLLREEGLEYSEGIVPLTGVDEQNIFLTLYARQKNPRAKTITRISRMEFRDMLPSLNLGSVVDPKAITTDRIIGYVRAKNNSVRADEIETLYNLYDGRVEAVEFIAGDDSPVVGKRLMDLNLKNNLLVTCIQRGGKILIPGGQDKILPGDSALIVTSHLGLSQLSEILA